MSQRTVLQLNLIYRAFHTQTLAPSLPATTTTARALKRAAATCLMLCGLMFANPLSIAEEVQRGPDVVIIAGKDKVVYEFRQNGELRMVRVVPKWGKPYYLVPRDGTEGFGNLERADMLLPQWIIAEF